MILKIFIVWRIGLFLITYLGSQTFPKIANSGIGAIGPNQPFDYWASWAQWDGGHYFSISQRGYQLLGDYAFFPLYPSVVKLLDFATNNTLLSGLIISNISFLLFLIVFAKVLTLRFNKSVAFSSVITFLLFPTTFFAVSFYSESLFLLLTVLVFLFLKNRNFLLASIAASFASVTRLPGVTLAIAISWAYFANLQFNLGKIKSRSLYICVAFFGFAVYSIFLAANLNDPFAYLSSQSQWQRAVTDPISTIFSYLWAFAHLEHRPINDYFDLLLTTAFLAILILGIRKIPTSWWIFSILVILLPASTGTLTSMPRYLLASLGAFVILGQYFNKSPQVKLTLWTISLALQAILATLFINGYWVA